MQHVGGVGRDRTATIAIDSKTAKLARRRPTKKSPTPSPRQPAGERAVAARPGPRSTWDGKECSSRRDIGPLGRQLRRPTIEWPLDKAPPPPRRRGGGSIVVGRRRSDPDPLLARDRAAVGRPLGLARPAVEAAGVGDARQVGQSGRLAPRPWRLWPWPRRPGMRASGGDRLEACASGGRGVVPSPESPRGP